MNVLHSILSSRILLHLCQAAEKTFHSHERSSSDAEASDIKLATPTDCVGFELSTIGITPSIIEAHLEGEISSRVDDVYLEP